MFELENSLRKYISSLGIVVTSHFIVSGRYQALAECYRPYIISLNPLNNLEIGIENAWFFFFFW
jgi:hypothetical protein